jgi:hypothetical protein
MLIVIGCDPGPEKSALVCFDGEIVTDAMFGENASIEMWLGGLVDGGVRSVLVIEKVESFGMAVGAEVFETVFHSGRFAKAFEPRQVERLPRRVIKQHLCHTARATDANIRQAILDQFGGADKAIGRKKTPGPLYELKGHMWSAFAVALTWYDQWGHLPEQIRPGIQPEF